MPGGRKGKYEYWLTEDGLTLLEGWARDGLTEEQIAKDKIGISRSTLNEWKKKFPDFSDTLKRGKEIVDIQAENALLKKALGGKYTEEVSRAVENPETGETTLQVVQRTTKEIPPDTAALIFWLKNRRPDKWRDKRDVNMEAEIKNENPFEGLTTEELRKLIQDG